MRVHKILFFIFLTMSHLLFLQAGESVHAASTVTRERFPDADTVIIEENDKTVYQDDGTSFTRTESYEKIMTERGRRENKNQNFNFMLPYTEVKIEKLEIIKPDGSVKKIDVDKNSRVMVDSSQMNSNIYNPNCKILTTSLPGLEINDIIHQVVTRNNKKTRVPDTWSGYNIFEYTSPIIKAVLTIDAPDSLKLENIKIRSRLKGKIVSSVENLNGRTIYRWQARDIPRIFEEPDMPPYWTVVQRLLTSTIKDWKYLSRWYWNLCEPRLEKTTPEMKKKVRELTADAKNDSEKIRAIFKFVSQEIRYMGITTEKTAPGYEPHDVCITFENRYGVCRDKAALLAAMLRIAGFKAFPVLINNGPKKDTGIPQPYFNHAITAVDPGNGEYILMDSTDESTKDLFPAYLCNKSYLVARPEGEGLRTSPVISADKNLLLINTDARLTETGGIKAETELNFQGVNDGIYRGAFSRWKEEKRREFFAGRLKKILAGAILKDITIKPENLRNTLEPLTVKLKYEASSFLIAGRENVIFKMPWFGKSFGVVNFILGKTGLKKRRFPLLTEIACGVKENIKLRLDGVTGKPLSLPECKPVENPDIEWKRVLRVDKNILSGQGTFLIKAVEFSPSRYLALKKALENIEVESRKMPVFAGKPAKANREAVIENENVHIRLFSRHACEIRKKARIRICSYAGVKKNSEIKVNYNSAWEDVSVKASVTLPDGTVRKLRKEEINIMDEPWVSSAPRYPAGKILVASLPGVAEEAVIEYEIIRKIKRRPFLSFLSYFRYSDELKRKKLTIEYPDNIDVRHSTKNGNIKFASARGKTGTKLCFSSVLQPPVKDEANQPPWWAFNPSIFISVADSWKKYSTLLSEKLYEAAQKDKKATSIALKLTKNIKDNNRKIVKIRNFIEKNIKTAGPSFYSLPLDCLTPADTTLKDGYGNRADKAVLYYSMLKAAGFEPDFTAVSAFPAKPSKITSPLLKTPQRFVFDSILISVSPDNKKIIYLNDTNQYAELGATGFEGKRALRLSSDGEISEITVPSPLETASKTNYVVRIAMDGEAELNKTSSFSGMLYSAFHRKFAEMTPEKRKRYFQEAVSEVSRGALPVKGLNTNYDHYPGTESFSVKIPHFAVRTGKYMYFQLPGFNLDEYVRLNSETRQSPFYSARGVRFKLNYALKLPESTAEIKILPRDVKWKSASGLGFVEVKVKKISGNELSVKCLVELNPAIIAPSHYSELLEINKILSEPSMKIILISLN